MENKNNFQCQLWEEIFLSLSKITKLSDYYSDKKFNNNDLPVSKLFYDLFQLNIEIKDIIMNFERIIIESNINNEIINSPEKLLNFLLYALHKESLLENDIMQEKNININNKSENFENENEALDYFELINNNNKSFIQKYFFGIKKIRKSCKECNKDYYIFNYFKFAPLDIKEISGIVDIRALYNNIFREFEIDMHCINCKRNTLFNIKIEIVEMPKYLIILLYNHKEDIEIKFLDNEFDNNYYLKSFIIKKEKSKLNKLFNFFKCGKVDNKKYKLFCVEDDKYYTLNENGRDYCDKEDIPEKPYFIIYKNKKEKKKKKLNKKNPEESGERLISDGSNKRQMKPKINTIKKSKIVGESIKSSTEGERIIRLYFKYKIKNETYFIDIENTKTFEIILTELKEKFGLSAFNNINLFYLGNKINKKKTPLILGIPHGSYIYISPDS